MKNLELLLVVDNSDFCLDTQTSSVLDGFKENRKIRIVVNEKSGFVHALNSGVRAARGIYLARMDGDDISLPNRLELQVRAIEQMHLDLVGGWAYVIDEQGSRVGQLTPPTDAHSIRRTIMLHNPFLHSTVLFKKSILQASGLYNPALFGAEDYDLWLRLVSMGCACANLPNYVVLLRETSNSIMRGQKWKTTRANYAKAKALGLALHGYYDPLSVTFCLIGPFSLLIGPKMASNLKLLFKWSRQTSSDSSLPKK
jgi:glycosyltransferase involved in cell wall biosynthesis